VANELNRAEPWLNPDGTPTVEFAEAIENLIRESNEMTTNAKLAQTRISVLTAVKLYTAPASDESGNGTVITQFVANDPAGAATFDVHIGTVADATTLVVDNETALALGVSVPHLISAMIAPGESLFVTVSAINKIVFLVSGIEK